MTKKANYPVDPESLALDLGLKVITSNWTREELPADEEIYRQAQDNKMGFYWEDERTIYVHGGLPIEWQRQVIAHEIMEAFYSTARRYIEFTASGGRTLDLERDGACNLVGTEILAPTAQVILECSRLLAFRKQQIAADRKEDGLPPGDEPTQAALTVIMKTIDEDLADKFGVPLEFMTPRLDWLRRLS
jgi:hypothetical protein